MSGGRDNVLPVVVTGAAGRMGREVVRAIHEADGVVLAAAVDKQKVGLDAGDLAGVGIINIPIEAELEAALQRVGDAVMVDFSLPEAVMDNARAAIERGVSPVI